MIVILVEVPMICNRNSANGKKSSMIIRLIYECGVLDAG